MINSTYVHQVIQITEREGDHNYQVWQVFGSHRMWVAQYPMQTGVRCPKNWEMGA